MIIKLATAISPNPTAITYNRYLKYRKVLLKYLLIIILGSLLCIGFIFYDYISEIIVALMIRFNILLLGAKKYVLGLTFKKGTVLMISGLTKRYLIDNVIIKHLHKNFIVHIKKPIIDLFIHLKNKFKKLELKKKLTTILLMFLPVVVVSYILYFLGLLGTLTGRLFSVQIWKATLVYFLKFTTTFTYFFKDYLWNSWLAPIIEIVIFNWILSLLEKIPFIGKLLKKIYYQFRYIIIIIKKWFHKHIDLPIKKYLRTKAECINDKIYSNIN